MKHVTTCYLLALVAIIAGCGGAKHPAHGPARLPSALAHTWASQATQIANALAANDGCGAQRLAATLETEYVRAVNGRTLPQRFRETLGSALNDLKSRITCTPPATTTAPEPKHGPPPPPHDHHGHGHDHGGGG
ncbi:MAG TPA: hypothetical protein VE261_07480 [Gaiellaceae bacterium]|nr:hypothetical protein [Gaiellaceae bacterium]